MLRSHFRYSLRIASSWIHLCFALVGSAACVDRLGPDVGDPVAAIDGSVAGDSSVAPGGAFSCEDSDPNLDVGYAADIEPLFAGDFDCLRCHRPGGDGQSQSKFDVSSYATLMAGGERTGSAIVVPGQPCSSMLLDKLGPEPSFGRRMPRNGPPYFSDTDMQLLADWISEGALDN